MAELPTTDPRVFGVTPYMSDETLREYTHKDIAKMLRNDFNDFLKSPTQVNMHVVVQQLLSYQDSALIGRNRKIADT